MSSNASFYVEYATGEGDTLNWTYDPDGFGSAGCSGWKALLGLVPAVSAQGRRFHGIAARGFPDDMDEATIAAMLHGRHLIDNTDDEWPGWGGNLPHISRDENTSLAWFTLADLNAAIASDADFVMDRWGYTKSETIESASEVIDRAQERATFEKVPTERIRFIVAID